MKRILVVSDIHGEYEKLLNVLDEAKYNPKEDQLILLGDYIDRGLYSKQVVEFVMELVGEGAIALKGNHEDMFLRSFEDEDWLENWIRNGARKTIDSYDGDMELMEEHANWMKENLKLYYETNEYIFVHAGLLPDTPLEWQEEEDMLWIRHNDEIGLGKIVIHGHTPVKEIERHFDQINIDTGAFKGGKLSLLELPSQKVYEAY